MVKPHGEEFFGISYSIAILIMVTGIVRINKDEHVIQRRLRPHVVIADNHTPMPPPLHIFYQNRTTM